MFDKIYILSQIKFIILIYKITINLLISEQNNEIDLISWGKQKQFSRMFFNKKKNWKAFNYAFGRKIR